MQWRTLSFGLFKLNILDAATNNSFEKTSSLPGSGVLFDANALLYALNASRNYDPSSQLGKIQAWVMFVNSADDFINPPELGIAEREIKHVRKGRFVLIPVSDQTHGHGTHTYAAVWQEYLKELLDESKP